MGAEGLLSDYMSKTDPTHLKDLADRGLIEYSGGECNHTETQFHVRNPALLVFSCPTSEYERRFHRSSVNSARKIDKHKKTAEKQAKSPERVKNSKKASKVLKCLKVVKICSKNIKNLGKMNKNA